jgi:hypothetical protein
MQNSSSDFFEVMEVATEKKEVFETARDVSLFLSGGIQTVFFKIFKNGKEVPIFGVNLKHLKSYLQAA